MSQQRYNTSNEQQRYKRRPRDISIAANILSSKVQSNTFGKALQEHEAVTQYKRSTRKERERRRKEQTSENRLNQTIMTPFTFTQSFNSSQRRQPVDATGQQIQMS